ncbi:MAG: hypothetical protein LBD71_05950 [Treponema sp.]|jgi:hypothetical protein|nr:hypothetical protein [Treponema sp.]
MSFIVTRRTAARLVFIVGFLLMFFGSAFLIGSMAGISRISVLASFGFVLLGVLCAVFALRLNKSSLYLFFAAFFLQMGFFLLLSALAIVPVSFSKSWPLLSIFSGLALFPAGWRRYGCLRSRYVVPSVFFAVLGSILMIFSLDLVSFSFARFVLDWWPLLVVLTGLVLVLISLGTRSYFGNNPPDSNGDSGDSRR